jgi:hypothetical protein
VAVPMLAEVIATFTISSYVAKVGDEEETPWLTREPSAALTT